MTTFSHFSDEELRLGEGEPSPITVIAEGFELRSPKHSSLLISSHIV